MACGCHHFKAGQRLEVPECSHHLNASGWPEVEPVQKHVNKCEQRIISEHNAIILLRLRHEWHTTISFWALMWHRSIWVFSFPPLNTASNAAIMPDKWKFHSICPTKIVPGRRFKKNFCYLFEQLANWAKLPALWLKTNTRHTIGKT